METNQKATLANDRSNSSSSSASSALLMELSPADKVESVLTTMRIAAAGAHMFPRAAGGRACTQKALQDLQLLRMIMARSWELPLSTRYASPQNAHYARSKLVDLGACRVTRPSKTGSED